MTWPPSLPFALVLARARTLDQSAVSLLYRRFLPVVYRYVLARVGDVHHAEDITSDTFFSMIEGIRGTRAQDELGFAAWVLGIARNKVALHFRRQRTRAELQHDIPEDAQPQTYADEDDPLEIITAREGLGVIAEALNRLTEEQRAVVLYRCVLDYSTEDVARLLDKQPGTIRALQFRALHSLARHLGMTEATPNGGPARATRTRREGRRGDATRG